MVTTPGFRSSGWWLVAMIVLGVLGYLDLSRVQRTRTVSRLEMEPRAADPHTPTGYAGNQRQFVVPERNPESYQWIAHTQEALAEGKTRLRHSTFDNWPEGRPVHTPSLYRWYLAAFARTHHAVVGSPVGQSVEWAALLTGPLLRCIALLALLVYTGRRFGALASALFALGWLCLFPFSVTFLAGQPDAADLARVLALGSVLLLAGTLHPGEGAPASHQSRRAFILSGILAGAGLWLTQSLVVPVIVGVGLGALAARVRSGKGATSTDGSAVMPMPWLSWGIAGAVTVLLGFFADNGFAPPSTWVLEALHPLYALSWFGLAVLLDLAMRSPFRQVRWRWARAFAGLTALLSLPVALWLAKNPGFLLKGPLDHRLHGLSDSPAATSLAAWISLSPPLPALVVILLPLLLAAACAAMLRGTKTEIREHRGLLVCLGAVLLTAGWACFRIRGWSTAGMLVLPLLALAGNRLSQATLSNARRNAWLAVLGLLLLPGLLLTSVSATKGGADQLTEKDAEALLERRLARWLRARMGAEDVCVLASPGLSASLAYFGGIRVIASPYPENQHGFQTAVRIASSTSPDEAQALASGRRLTHIALASWSPELSAMALLKPREGDAPSLIDQLENWLPPRWLRPVAYRLPSVEGLPDHTLALFEVVELQDQATALARLAEYFAEMGQMKQALAVVGTLIHHFPEDTGGAAARAQVAAAQRDRPEFSEAVRVLLRGYSQPEIDALDWERRVSVALVLAQAQRAEAARATLQACLSEVDEARLRSLSPAALYRLILAARTMGLGFEEMPLYPRALEMLPPEMQAAVSPAR